MQLLENLHERHMQFVQKKKKKRKCKSEVHMKHHPNSTVKNIMVFHTLAN